MSVNECRSGMNPWGVKCTAGANKNETIFVKRDLFVIMDKKHSHTFMRNKFHIISDFKLNEKNYSLLKS